MNDGSDQGTHDGEGRFHCGGGAHTQNSCLAINAARTHGAAADFAELIHMKTTEQMMATFGMDGSTFRPPSHPASRKLQSPQFILSLIDPIKDQPIVYVRDGTVINRFVTGNDLNLEAFPPFNVRDSVELEDFAGSQ